VPDSPKTLREIQEECRRFAAEIGDPKAARILSRAADDLERHAQESARPGRLPNFFKKALAEPSPQN